MAADVDASPGQVVAALRPAEYGDLVGALLADRPHLVEVVEGSAADLLRDVDREDVSCRVADTYRAVGFTAVAGRVGRQPWGYVDEHEARWQMLEELLEPFLEDIERRWRLGLEEAAVELAYGVLAGPYELRGADEHTLIGWGATHEDTYHLAAGIRSTFRRVGAELPPSVEADLTPDRERWR